MHRETLSRTLLYSHNFIGKSSLVPLQLRGPTARLGTSTSPLQSPAVTLSRCYHRSWEKTAQSVTLTKAVSDGKDGVAKSSTIPVDMRTDKSGDKGPISIVPPPRFNLKAKDILSTTDDGSTAVISNTRIEKEGSSVADERSLLESRIFLSNSVDELLNFSEQQELTLRHACQIIARLGQVVVMKPESQSALAMKVQTDKRFIRILNLIQRGNHSQLPHILLQALIGLQKLGLESSPEVLRLLERELSWSMRRCPLRFLAKSVGILSGNSVSEVKTFGTDKDASILQSAVQVLNRRWIEAISGGDFIALFRVIHLFDDERKQKIEERAADLAHQFTPTEMAQIFIVLGAKKRRPTPLLRALSFHYSKSEYRLSAKETIDLIYAMNDLTFADPVLMNRLCTDLSDEIPSIRNVVLISSLMTSLGQMRYRQKDILLAVDEWLMKHIKDLRVFDFAVWLQSAATLGHQSQNIPIFCDVAQKVLTQPTASSPSEWVNIVHSFVVLNKFNNDMLSSVLNETFVESIESLGVKSTRQKVKLLNVNHIARHVAKNYKGPFLADSKMKEWTTAYVNSSDEKLSQLVSESLGNFLPTSKYLELNCQLESGVFVDAICYVDSKMKPVTLDVAKSKSRPTKRIAVVVEGYPALCLGQKERTGQSSLNIKLLENEQYLVVNVPYTEFNYSDKLVRRVQYLEQKIKAISQQPAEKSDKAV